VLIAAAFIDYTPRQTVLISSLATTTETAQTNAVGPVGATVAAAGLLFLGLAAWMVPVFLLLIAGLYLFRLGNTVGLLRLGAMFLTVLTGTGVAALAQVEFLPDSLAADLPNNLFREGLGGIAGTLLYEKALRANIGPFGGGLVLVVSYVIFLGASLLENPSRTFDRFIHKAAGWRKARREQAAARRSEREKRKQMRAEEKSLTGKTRKKAGKSSLAPYGTVDAPPPAGLEDIEELPPEPTPAEPASATEEPAGGSEPPAEGRNGRKSRSLRFGERSKEDGELRIVESERVMKAKPKIPEREGDYVFPSLELLTEPDEEKEQSPQDHQEIARNLVTVLDQFGVKVTPSEVHTGPVITRYEVKPAAGVRVEKIVNLDKNIALGLKAEAVRILAPVPGKGTVGIEVPNRHATPVCIREILESAAWADARAEIPVVLGKEVTGRPVVTDLTKMPHLLIAGATGSGKTVCINAVIASLLYHASPRDLRFLMVDPKIVEMQVYNDLPHMLIPVVTEPKKVPGALKYLIGEMERRYQIFAKAGVRNIAGFNAKLAKDKDEEARAAEMDNELSPEERAAAASLEVPRDEGVELEMPKEKMPYIVCVIDELADLMMVAPADIEQGIARLAQLARAAGIHLIIATQRPSVNVITGVIKANLPSRIAFKVASKVDSRTILDGQGADKLIGKGDMLFIPPGTSQMIRAQGAFVSDEEINKVVEYLKRNGPPQYDETVRQKIESGGEDGGEGDEHSWDDDLVPDALDVIRSSKRASTSMLQRRLKIGYNRAARIMEILEDEGIVGPENGSSPREILRDPDSW